MSEELSSKYEELKGIIDVLPTNTKYNRKRKYDYIIEEEKKDEKRLNDIKKEIEFRIKKLLDLKPNPEFRTLEEEINKCNVINEWNPYNTSYEKMHLDYYLYQLNRYYKEDLESLNDCIYRILESFKNVSINLNKEDFSFNKFSKEYMEKIFSNASSEELASSFESLYWKNPEIIRTIEVNFKSLYLKNEKLINKYYETRHEEFLKSHQDSELYNMRIDLSQKLNSLKNIDKYLIFKNFQEGTYQLGDYKDMDNKKSKYFSEDSYDYNSLMELYNILNEYKIVINYKYLFTDMKDKLEKKDTLKNVRATTLKKINSEEGKLNKINKKQSKKPLFGKKKYDEKWIFDYKTSLNNIIELYKELDTSNYDELVFTKLNKDSDLLEILKLITSNYLYFVNKTLEVNEEESIATINEKYNKLRNYINTNNFYLLNNIHLLDELQLKSLIVDKYNIEHINITIDQLLDENIDNTILDIKRIIEYEDIVKSGIKLDDISLYLEYQKLTN